MPPIPPTEFLLYYAGGFLALILALFWRRPKRGMRLRLRGGGGGGGGNGSRRLTSDPTRRGRLSDLATTTPRANAGERALNVVFNFNGHSWDAYEVLGLPAGSALATVEAAYRECLDRVDETSRPFLHAAFKAIQENSKSRAV